MSVEDDDDKAREDIQIPVHVFEILKSSDSWFFNVFDFNEKTENKPLKYLSIYLFHHYHLFRKFNMSPIIFNNFITKIENGNQIYKNPYHNNLHAADVTQTMNAILCETNLIEWLTDLEIFASLFSAIIHDYDHDGKTNQFHVATGSERAMIYNDRSVQENHHISATFLLFKNDNYNILKNLSRDDYRNFRDMVIDLVLSTDMAFHFQQLKDIGNRTKSPGQPMIKNKALAFTLHAADISNQIKKYPINTLWTNLIMQEFFAQGDEERQRKLPISPLCDRCATCTSETQLNFIDFIVKPTFTTLVTMVHFILGGKRGHDKKQVRKPWIQCLTENRKKWVEKVIEESPSVLVWQRSSI